jgi:Tol biopolymer transport system component
MSGGRRLGRLAGVLALVVWGCLRGAPQPHAGEPRIRRIALPPDATRDALGPAFPSLDARCRKLAFAVGGDVYVHDLATGTSERASDALSGTRGNRPSSVPVLSARGGHLAFDSAATDLVPGPANRHDHVYVRDLVRRTTRRVSLASDGALAEGASLAFHPGLALSGDGSVVAFPSHAANLVEGDTNGRIDVFVHDVATSRTTRVSVSSRGEQGDGDSQAPSLSADGRFVAFSSTASQLVPDDANGFSDVFVHDRTSGRTELVSAAAGGAGGDGASDLPSLSADGRWLAFASDATNLLPGQAGRGRGVFVADRARGALQRVAAADGQARTDDWPAIDASGARVAFLSQALPADAGAAPGVRDVGLWERASGGVVWVSRSRVGAPADDESGDWGLAISGDGRCLAFTSLAGNLVPDDRDGRSDLFLAEIR